MSSILTKPSFYALISTGIFILVLLIIYVRNIKKISFDTKLIFLSLFGILIGIHGLLHLGLEYIYNYNPLENIIYPQ